MIKNPESIGNAKNIVPQNILSSAKAKIDGLRHEIKTLIARVTAEQPKDAVYAKRKPLFPYYVTALSKEAQEKCKAGTDDLLGALHSNSLPDLDALCKRPNGSYSWNPPGIKALLEKETFNEEELTLMAIGLFLLREKSEWVSHQENSMRW